MSSTPVPTKPEEPKPTQPASGDHAMGNRATYKPDNLEKKFLVWTGKYKSVDEIPEYIKYEAFYERHCGICWIKF